MFMVATSSLILACSLATALNGLSRGVTEKLQEDLKAYGANILIQREKVPLKIGIAGLELGQKTEEGYLSAKEVTAALRRYKGLVDSYALYLRSDVSIRPDKPIPIVGGDFLEINKIATWWQIEGRWPHKDKEVLIGKGLAKRLNTRLGDFISLIHQEKRVQVKVVGIVETGSWEDKVLFMELAQAQELFSLPDKISIALVRANTSNYPVSMIAQALEKGVTGAEVRTIHQVADSEQSLLSKLRWFMALAILTALVSTFICTMSTVSASLLERRRDIGLLLALGASFKFIYRLLLTEALAMGFLGGLAGYAFGALLIQLMAKSIWGIFVPVQLHLVLLSLVVGAVVAGLASIWPIKSALREGPGSCLRG